MFINIHRVDELPANPKPAHGYAVSTGPDTCDLYFVNKPGGIIKRVTDSNLGVNGDIITLMDATWDASNGSLPAGTTAGSAYIVSTPGIIDGVYFGVGEWFISTVDDADTASIDPDWFMPHPDKVVHKAHEFIATAGQIAFPLPSVPLPESVSCSFEGYSLIFGSNLTVAGNIATLPDLGFDLEAGEKVAFAYVETKPL